MSSAYLFKSDGILIVLYTAISRKAVGKKVPNKVHATRPKGGLDIHWNVAYWPKGNEQVCILHVKNLFFLSGGLWLPLPHPVFYFRL